MPTLPNLRAAPLLIIALAALSLCGQAFAQAAPESLAEVGPKVSAAPTISDRTMARLPRVASRLAIGGDIRIVAFGSSSTEGAGASSPAATYPALLQRDLEQRLQGAAAGPSSVAVINRGKGGDDAESMALRLDRDVLADRPDLVIWQTGSNDPMSGVTLERFVQLTREGIAAMRAAGADVILMDQQWCRRLSATPGATQYSTALHDLGAELGVPVIRRHALMRTWAANGLLAPTQMIGPDGLHMTDAGYDRLAKAATLQILLHAGLAQPNAARN